MVSVVYWAFWVAGSNRTLLRINFFFLSNWRHLHFHEHFQLEISSECDIKAENRSTLCRFHEGRKGLLSMGSNADLTLISSKPPPFLLADGVFWSWFGETRRLRGAEESGDEDVFVRDIACSIRTSLLNENVGSKWWRDSSDTALFAGSN